MRTRHFLLAALFLPVAVCTANAQDDTLRVVTISSSRIPSTFSASTRTVDVIDSSYLSKVPATTVQEVLDYVAGVEVRNRGARGVQSDISIRGSNFEQALIMVNGVKVSDPQTGHHVLNLPVNLDDIERIEILKGAGARAYGQNAFSGAINIITKNPEQTQLRLRLLYGQHNLREASLGFTHVQKDVSQTVSGSYGAADGYRYNTDFENQNLFYTAQLKTGGSKMLVNAGYNNKKFGANGFYSDRFPDQWETTRTLFFSAGLQTSGKNTFAPRVYFRQHNDEFLLKRHEPAFYRNLHTTNVAGAEFNYNLHTKLGVTALGGEIRNEVLHSKSLGDAERQNAGFTLEHRFRFFERLTFTPGFFLNWTNKAQWQLYPGAEVGITLTDQLSVYGSANKSFRIPSFTELYYTDPANKGNADLKPEQAWTYEGGLRYLNNGHALRLAAFNRRGTNLIDWLLTGNVWMAGNIGRISTKGGEAQYSYLFTEQLPAFFLTRVDLQYAYLTSSSDLGADQAKYLLDHLRHQVILGVDHRIVKSLLHAVKLRYEDRALYTPYWLLDSRLYWKGNHYTAYVQAHNLLGTPYTEIGRITAPGRWISVGAEYTLPIRKKQL